MANVKALNHGDEHVGSDFEPGCEAGRHSVRDDRPDPQHNSTAGEVVAATQRPRLHAYQYRQPRSANELAAEAESVYTEFRSVEVPEDVCEAAQALAQAAADFAALLMPADERSILTARTAQAACDGTLRGLLWNMVSGHRWMQRREYDYLCARTDADATEAKGKYAGQVAEFDSVLHAVRALEAHAGSVTKEVLLDTIGRVEAFELGKTPGASVQEAKKASREAELRNIRAAMRKVS